MTPISPSSASCRSIPASAWFATRFGADWNDKLRALATAREDHERALFARDNAGYRAVKHDAYRIMAKTLAANYLGMRVVQVLILIAGAHYVIGGDLSVGGFVGFLLLINVFYQPLEKIAASLAVQGQSVSQFGLSTPKELAPKQMTTVDIPVDLSLANAGAALTKALSGGSTAVQLTGEAVLGGKSVPINLSTSVK